MSLCDENEDYDLLDYYCEMEDEYEPYIKMFEDYSRSYKRDKARFRELTISPLNQKNIDRHNLFYKNVNAQR